jgi:arylmalonate decarboxylase
MAQPLIGLIVPPRGPFLPPDSRRYPGTDFAVEGLGIDEMTVPDFDASRERIVEAAATLGRRGVNAIAMLGTSLSFFRGPAYNADIREKIEQAAGCPAVTATTAVVDALRARSARRLAVGSAYEDGMNARLRSYLEEEGFEIAGLVGMSIRKVRDAMAVADAAIVALADAACDKAGGADALLVSCGAFATGHLLAPLEARCRMPVVSSTPAALEAAVRAALRTAP